MPKILKFSPLNYRVVNYILNSILRPCGEFTFNMVQLSQPSTDGIEMRVCKNKDVANEEFAFEIVEIYVQ